MKIRFLLPVMALAFPVLLWSCGSGGAMGDAKEGSNLTGDLPGTGAVSEDALDYASGGNAKQSTTIASNSVTDSNSTTAADTLVAGEVVKVDSTEARGNSRWSDKQAITTTTSNRLDKTAGVRARHSLIGSNPKNYSRVGQSLSASNPERKNEEIFIPK